MFASFIGDLATRARDDGGALILECEPRLVSLFARSFPRRDREAQSDAGERRRDHRPIWLAQGCRRGECRDRAWQPAAHSALSIDAISNPNAYLVPDADETARWRTTFSALETGLHIGICWRSGKMGGSARSAIRTAGSMGRVYSRPAGRDRCGAIRCRAGGNRRTRGDERTPDRRTTAARSEKRTRPHLRDAFGARMRW